MEAIHLYSGARPHRFACRAIAVNPDPPQVGVATTISLFLKNAGDKPVTVSRIETMVSQFGMGAAWEQLPVIGPLLLRPDADRMEEVSIEWTPRSGGHRCVRTKIHMESALDPIFAGCNLHVIESEAERSHWRVPFRLGNPEDARMPIVLGIGANDAALVDAHVLVNGRMVKHGEPIWLEAHEEVDALLLLHARTEGALDSVHMVEASSGGRFIDGIQIEVRRPARVSYGSRAARRSARWEERECILDEVEILMAR